ncbi:MarR family transcriptional regulator [Acuticoccus sp. MNP-M23]|uniref:MarR family winged helix-turn-helix transcriptional regulator n=1 Tax=Acuticoccus sp. MNP-M23 TaxID=3072793 RepID=UPI002815EC0D|nr:MarR family transcriptional regulator [Acuticoccus sp. MNP-M23]WMS41580.1 MarR family transcriptional regulator [Acuticoccus sp. MNP-M23]
MKRIADRSSDDALKLEEQLCFPIYAAANATVRLYRPLLDPLGLTYLQYLVMLILWEHAPVSVGEIGRLLVLDSGTLTPLLKRLEANGLVSRRRDSDDERRVLIGLTAEGLEMREKVKTIPNDVLQCTQFSEKDTEELISAVFTLRRLFLANR